MIYPQISFAQDITTYITIANDYFEKAGVFEDSLQYDSAIVYFEKASTLYQEHEQWRMYLQSETKLGVCYRNQWQLDRAIATIKPGINKSLQHINEIDTIVADAYADLGLLYYYQSQNDSALFYWNKTLQIRKKLLGEKHTDMARSYINIGVIYDIQNEYDLALQYYFRSLHITRDLLGEKNAIVADIYNNIGVVYYEKNEYDLALQYCFESVEIKKELLGENNLDIASSYNNIGMVYNSKKEFDLALQYYLKSLEIRKELLGEKHTDIAASYINIGAVYNGKNESDLALQYYLKSIEIYEDLLGEKHAVVALGYNNIGVVYNGKKEYDKALQYYFKSLEIYKDLLGEEHTDIARSLNNIGMVYNNINDYDLALHYFFKSIRIRRELLGEKHTDMARSYNNIGMVYNNKNDYGLTLHYYQKAIASSLRNFNDTIDVYTVPLIKDYLNWDRLLNALHTKAKILGTLWELTETDSVLDSSQPRPPPGSVKIERVDYLKYALSHYRACDTLINQVRRSIITKSDKIALGEQASQVYKGAVEVCINLAASSYSRQEGAGSDSVSYYNEQAFYFSEKNKSSVLLEALAGAEAQKFAGIPDSLLQKEHQLQIDIALYKRILAQQPDSAKETLFRDKLFKANRQYDELITLFESQYSDYFELKYNRKPAELKEIQDLLDTETAIISYVTGDSMITIFIITKNSLDVKPASAFENLAYTIGDFRYGLLHPNISMSAEDYKKNAFRMYKQLLPANISEEIKDLIIIPDAELCMIPFETLLTEDPEDKEWKELPYLIKKYNFSYSYSANLFYKTFPKEPTTDIEFTDLNDWIAFAPVFDDSSTTGMSMRTLELLQQLDSELHDTAGSRGTLIKAGNIRPLPETESEVRSIFKQFDEKGKRALVQIKNNANEEVIKSGELRNYRLLHFATHGFVNTSKPELSGILLAQDTTISEDGILYSGEIYNLKLNADLTVLSACETGLGEIKEGEGLIGLSRALLFAGSKNIIVSLWKVADKSTSDLMIDFYNNLLEAEQDKQDFSQALHRAKLTMIEEGRFAHPFYWSPFILIGK
jgi:CHAT domain-containing protein/tetratricopeptide (TPR) repeat protein